MKKKIFLITISFYFFSCKNEKSKLINENLFIISEQLVIQLNEYSPLNSEFTQIINIENKEYLLFENKNSNGFDLYDIENKNLHKQVFIPAVGPQFISEIDGLIYVNKDSIFITDRRRISNLLLTDIYGKIKQKYGNREVPFLSHTSNSRMPTYFISNKLHLLVVPFLDFSDPYAYHDFVPLEHTFDLTNNQLDTIDFTYPEKYKEGAWGITHAIPCRIFDGEKFVYSFGIDEHIYTRDLEGNIKKYLAKSEYHQNKISPYKSHHSTATYLIETDLYADIFYDPYREVYYRFFRRGIPSMKSDGSSESWFNKPTSIIVLDKDFNKVGEYPLDPIINYFPREMMVGEKGLYISNNHPENPNTDEDYLKFTILELNR